MNQEKNYTKVYPDKVEEKFGWPAMYKFSSLEEYSKVKGKHSEIKNNLLK